MWNRFRVPPPLAEINEKNSASINDVICREVNDANYAGRNKFLVAIFEINMMNIAGKEKEF